MASVIFDGLFSRLLGISLGKNTGPDWAEAALLASETLLASLVVLGLLINLDRPKKIARQQGFDITVSAWQYR